VGVFHLCGTPKSKAKVNSAYVNFFEAEKILWVCPNMANTGFPDKHVCKFCKF
jgi:hypothetical protein